MTILTSINKRIRRIAAIVTLLALVASNTSGVAAAANPNRGALVGAAAGSSCSVGASGATYTKIQDAVNDAGCGTIIVAVGTYQENITISRDVTIKGAGANSTIVDGGFKAGMTSADICDQRRYNCTVFSISQPVTVTFSGLTIRNGYNIYGYAGGIHIQGAANVTVQDSIVSNNKAVTQDNTAPGGGIDFNANSGTLTVSNTTFSGNTAGFNGGGAIYNPGATMTVLNSTFSGNGGTSVEGGAIRSFGPTTIKNSTFSGNTGTGGALAVSMGTTTVINSTFANNQGGDSYGGAIYVDGGTLNMSNSTFANNQAGSHNGGAIYVRSGTLNVSSSTFSGNGAAQGGAITVDAGVATLKSTILANNTGGNCYYYAQHNGSLHDGGNNLRWPSTDNSCFGTFGDPKLAALADNGGATQTMALQAGSAAADTGACTDISGTTITTDQRGTARPLGLTCDIGAFESSLPRVPPVVSVPGLIGYWQLDEGSGTTAYDSSGSGKHATLAVPSAWSSDHAPTDFSNPFAYRSQLQNGYALNAPLMTTQLDNLTLAAWIKWDGGTGAHRFIVMNGNSASSGYGLIQYNTNGHIELIVAGKAFYDFGYTPPIGIWVHLALVRSSGTWRLYVNGMPQGGTTTTAPATPTGGFSIGSNGTNENFSGVIDDVRFYNRALSAGEIAALRGGCYFIQSQQTGYVLDVQGSNTALGARSSSGRRTRPPPRISCGVSPQMDISRAD